jgi:hypothetical protein
MKIEDLGLVHLLQTTVTCCVYDHPLANNFQSVQMNEYLTGDDTVYPRDTEGATVNVRFSSNFELVYCFLQQRGREAACLK